MSRSAADDPRPRPSLLLRVAGSFELLIDGAPIEPAALGSRKTRVLVRLLAVERGHLLSTDRIAEAVWGDAPPRDLAENVATLVSRARKALGRERIVGGRSGYRLAGPPLVIVDLDEADALVAQARRRLAVGEPGLAWAAAERAMEILGRGAVLEGEPDTIWAAQAEAGRRSALRLARQTGGRAALALGDPAAAISAAGAAIADDPWDEAACRLMMSACRNAGEPARAIAAYGRLRKRLDDELGVEPAPQTRELYLAILREEPRGVDDTAADAGARVGGVSSAPAQPPDLARDQPSGPPLVGRDGELASLGAAWSRAAAGRPSLMLLVGEAGIGKTRLASELVATCVATGGRVVRARCYETERALFLQPFVDALAPLFRAMSVEELRWAAGEGASVLAELIPLVGVALSPRPLARGSVALERRRAFDAVAQTLIRLAERAPLLLFFDDLQLAGEATVGLLHYLARQLGDARVFALATIRREEGAQSLAALSEVGDVVDVAPLSARAVAELARFFGQEHLVESIVRRTGGHTLFVVETLASLAAGQSGIPASLRVAVLDRVRRAGEPTETVLRAAAVLGATLDVSRLSALLDLPPQAVLERVEQASRKRLLVAADRAFEFANDLVREVLYESTPAPTRLAWHGRAADLLSDLPEAMAWHALASGDARRAGRAYLLAAEQAMSRFATADAESLASQAIAAADAVSDDELRARARVVRGRAREARSHYDEALDDLEQAAALARAAGDTRVEILALRQLAGDVPVALGLSVERSTVNLRRGLALAEALGDRGMEVDLLDRLAVISNSRLRFAECLTHGRRAVAIARAMGDERSLVIALDALKVAYAYLGEISELAGVIAELEPLARRNAELFVLQWTTFESAFIDVAAARWDAALARVVAASEINRSIGYDGIQPWNDAHLGWIERLRGDHEQALFYGRRAVEAKPSVAHPWWQVTAKSMLATTLLERGQVDEAVAVVRPALALAERDGAEAYLARCLAPLSEATASPDLLLRADTLLAGITAPPGSAWLPGADTYFSVARGWISVGEGLRARRVLAPVLTAAARTGWVAQWAEALLLDGRAASSLGLLDEAEQARAGAAEIAATYGLSRLSALLAS